MYQTSVVFLRKRPFIEKYLKIARRKKLSFYLNQTLFFKHVETIALVWDKIFWHQIYDRSLMKGRCYDAYGTEKVKKRAYRRNKRSCSRRGNGGWRLSASGYSWKQLFASGFFFNFEVYINNQQIKLSDGLYGQQSCFSNCLHGAISANKGLAMETFLMRLWRYLFLNIFRTRKTKLLNWPDGFLFGKLWVEFFLQCWSFVCKDDS